MDDLTEQQWQSMRPGALIAPPSTATKVSIEGPGGGQDLSFDGMHVESLEVEQGPGGAVVTVKLRRQRFVIGAPSDG